MGSRESHGNRNRLGTRKGQIALRAERRRGRKTDYRRGKTTENMNINQP